MIRVLVVDDVADFRQLARIVLEADGRFAVVAEAGDGGQAIDQARWYQPDVVVLDLAMPLLSGAEALAGIRTEAPNAKILLVSGVAAGENPGERLGADGYLEKGTFTRDLPDAVARLWAGSAWCARLRAPKWVSELTLERPTMSRARPVALHWDGSLQW